MDVRVGLWRKLRTEELMLLSCGVGEDSWESLGLQGNPTSLPKGNQCWTFIGKTDAVGEAPILWPTDAKSQLIGKDPDTEKDWGREKGATEDEMVGWHHWLNGHEFKQALGDGEGQRSGVCRSPWGSQRVGHDLGTKQQQSSCGDTSSLIGQQKVTTADILSLCHLLKKKRLLSLFVFSLSLNLYSVILVSYLKHRPTHPHL